MSGGITIINHMIPEWFYHADLKCLMTLYVDVSISAGETFMHDDVVRNILHYVHDGSHTTEDSMQILVTDGVTTATTQLEIHVSGTDSEGPRLAPGSLLTISVPEKSSETITRSHLAYTVSISFFPDG